MKKLFIAAILFVSSSCIKVIDPESNYITGDQLASSADALAGMVRAIPVRLVNYQNDDAGIEQCSYHGMLSMLEMMTTDMVVSGYGGFNTTSAYTYGNLSARGSNRGIYPFYMYYGYIKAVNDVIGLIDSETDDTTLKHYLGKHTVRFSTCRWVPYTNTKLRPIRGIPNITWRRNTILQNSLCPS